MHSLDDDLNDELPDLGGGKPDPIAQLIDGDRRAPKQPPVSFKQNTFEEGCPKCRGSGRFGYSGQCYSCKGVGKLVFKTSPEARAKSRASADKRKRDQQELNAQAIVEWKAMHKAEWDWMTRSVQRNPGFDFPAKMIEAVNKWAGLTDGSWPPCRSACCGTRLGRHSGSRRWRSGRPWTCRGWRPRSIRRGMRR